MRIKKYRHRYNKLSSRLIFSITFAIFICFGFFTYNVSTTIAETEIARFERDTEFLQQNISREINFIIESVDDANIHFESVLMNASSIEEERNGIENALDAYQEISRSFFILRSPKNNQIIEHYSLDENNQLDIIEPTIDIKSLVDSYEALGDYQLQSLYFDQTSKKLYTIKRFYQTATDKELLIGIELEESLLTQYVEHSDDNGLGNIGITDQNGIFMFHTNESLIGTSLKDLSISDEISEEISQALTDNKRVQQRIKNGLNHMEEIESSLSFIDTTNYTLMYLPIQIDHFDTTWGVAVDIRETVLNEGSFNIARTIILGGLITLIALMFIIKLIVHHGLKPIDDLMGVMNQVEDGNLDARTKIASCNEMEVIGNRLNGLLDHMIEDRDSILKQKNEIEELLIEVENLMQENDRIYYETIKSLAKTIDAKDQYTGGHCDRVTEYALYIGQEMGLKQDELSSLTYGAMLHDIGKIGIAESIITKEGRLTDEEYLAIKTHPEKGFEILKDINFLKDARLGVLHHHERYDGKGYPHGLAGEAIDLKARIIAIADAFDAMTSDRSYRKALSTEAAIDQLVQNKGIQFDPTMVDILVKGIHSTSIKL